MSDNKQKIISDIYNDRAGFGSKATTLKDAREKDKTITMQDVETFFRKNVEEKRKPRGYNSFIAPYNKHTYQVDITWFRPVEFEKVQKYKYAFTCIDVLSKYAVAVPLVEKSDLVDEMPDVIRRMGGKPKLIFSHDDGVLRGKQFTDYVESEGIEVHRSRGQAQFVERFNRTLKDMIFKRVEVDEKKGKVNIQWVDYLPEVMLTYNNKMVHSATGLVPNEARKKENELKARLNVANKAKKNRMYPELNVGDKVKIMRKKRTGEKERSSHWLQTEYTVEAINEKMGQTYYTLTGYNRPLLRFELLKL